MRAVSRFSGVVDRQHRAGHMAPGEARQDGAGEAGRVDLDDLLVAEEFVEAAAEMAARLHHHDAGGGDVEAERFEEHRVGALVAVGEDDDGDARPGAVPRSLAEVERVVGVDAAPAADRSGRAGAATTRGGEGFREVVAAAPVEAGLEWRAVPRSMGLGGQRGIVDDAHQCIPHAGGMKRLQDRHGVAAAAAAGIVGHVGEGQCRTALVLGRNRQATASSRLVRSGRNRSRRSQPAIAISRARSSAACWSVAVTTTVRPLNGRIGEGEPAHDGHVQHPPGIRRLVHALLAEVDQLAIGAVGRVLAGQLGHSRRHDRQADAARQVRVPPISRRSRTSAASAPRSRMSRCGLVR